MARNFYFVSYDISSPRTRRRVRRLVTDYAVSGQKSFFECWMTTEECARLKRAMQKEIDPSTDRMHVFAIDPTFPPVYLGCARRQSVDPFLLL